MNPKSYRLNRPPKKTTTSPPGSSSALIKDQQPKTLGYYLKSNYRFLFPYLVVLICVSSFLFVYAPPSNLLREVATSDENIPLIIVKEENSVTTSFCPALIDGKVNITAEEKDGEHVGMLCCDRSHHRTDVCYMEGDIRTDVAKSASIFLYNNISDQNHHVYEEKIRPYTRKWETSVMSTIDELTLVSVTNSSTSTDNDGMKCDVRHKVPAVVLSTGGYTGNLYHDFNDGLIPLYLTTERFKGEVVLLVLEYHSWWMSRYNSVVKKLSNHKIVNLGSDRRVHCFPTMIVGMKIHDELSIDSRLVPDGKGIQNFQALLHESFAGDKTTSTDREPHHRKRPKLTIFIRKGSRVLLNLQQLIKKSRSIGFQVGILNPKRTTPLSEIHSVLSTSDVMIAVHGAAMTHFMLVKPGSTLIQIVPLGLNWAADEYYGQPARKLGLEYVEYRVGPSESSLSKEYGLNHPVVTDPSSITSKGWEETKRIYLSHQNVTLDVRRFGKVIRRVYSNYLHRTNKKHH